MDKSEGFFVGMGGATFRAGMAKEFWLEVECCDMGRGCIGSERVEAFEAAREGLRVAGIGEACEVPSRFGTGEPEPDGEGEGFQGGAASLRAIGFALVPLLLAFCDPGVDVGVPLGLLKSMVLALAVPLAGGGTGLESRLDLLTSTQSGSGLGVNGLLGLFGFGKWSCEGGCTLLRAGRPTQ